MERRGFGWGLSMAGVCEFPAAGAKFPAIPAGPISDDRDFLPMRSGYPPGNIPPLGYLLRATFPGLSSPKFGPSLFEEGRGPLALVIGGHEAALGEALDEHGGLLAALDAGVHRHLGEADG